MRMRLAILSRNKSLHSTRRMLSESRKLGIQCEIVNPLDCQLIIDGERSAIMLGAQALQKYDAVLPRIGASITDYGLSVVQQFETLGTYTVNTSQSIASSRDKLRSLQILTSVGLKVPATVLTRTTRGLRAALECVKGLPVVLKVIQGTQGVGVMLIHTPIALDSVMQTLWGLQQDVMVQQFVAEGAGRDYRVF
ncbi:MAG: 30S ribosomal protein S6--L-glutamate ligase, partial [Bdellovibrionota bacterium]